MKKIIIFTLTLLIFSLHTGCSSKKSNKSSVLDSEPDASITNEKIHSNDEDMIALGNQLAKQLQMLYLDYLQYGYSKLSVSIDLHDIITIKTVDENGYAIYKFYNKVTSETSYDELYDKFNDYCTSDYSEELLNNTTHSYMDCDGQLYVSWKDGVVSGFLESKIDSYIIDGDIITFYFVSEIDGNYIGKSQLDGKFSLTLMKQNNKWLISDCSDVTMLGCFYSG